MNNIDPMVRIAECFDLIAKNYDRQTRIMDRIVAKFDKLEPLIDHMIEQAEREIAEDKARRERNQELNKGRGTIRRNPNKPSDVDG